MTPLIYLGNVILCFLTLLLKDADASNLNIAESAADQNLDDARTEAGIARQDVPDQKCRDDKEYADYCKTYRDNNICTKFPYGMQKYCALTCGFCKCKAKIDIGFLLDSSGSIEKSGKGNYKKCKDFIKNAVNGSFISEEYTHIGLVLFSSKREIVFNFTSFYDAKPMMKKIEDAPYNKGGTRTGIALTFVKNELFDKTGRKDVPRVLIVMTDGKSSDAVSKPAAQLKDDGVIVFAIGIGRNFDGNQLNAIASKPKEKYELWADFDQLNELYNNIRDDACRVNSTLSDMLPQHSAADDHAAFEPHGSHVMTQQITVLDTKSRVEGKPHSA